MAINGADGWLFLRTELRHIGVGPFWGPAAAAVSRAASPDKADPLPAIVDFVEQMKARGIEAVVVPVGDSRCLVFHAGGDLHGSGAGLADQLAAKRGRAVDGIGVRGSAATPARVNLLRRAKADPSYLANKKCLVLRRPRVHEELGLVAGAVRRWERRRIRSVAIAFLENSPMQTKLNIKTEIGKASFCGKRLG